jgi:hypothetical protein
MRWWATWGLVLVMLTAASGAGAQSSEQKALAESLFEEGRALLVKNDYAGACGKLAESQKLDPSIGTALYLGACYEKAGKTASAWASFLEAHDIAERQGDAKRSALAQQRAHALEPVLSKLVVNVPPASRVQGMTVLRDGQELTEAAWGSPEPVDDGVHTIEAKAPNKRTFSVSVNATGGTATADVPLLQDVQALPSPVLGAPPSSIETPNARDTLPTPGASRGPTQRVVGIAVGAVGVASLIIGVVGQLETSASVSNAQNLGCNTSVSPVACPNNTRGRAGYADMNDARTTWRPVSITGFVAGGVLAAGGVVVYLTAPRKRATAMGLGVLPLVELRGGAGLILQGPF